MALKIYDTLKPQGDYPAVKAEDVQMPDGKKLSEWNSVYPVTEGAAVIQPETYYVFGEVDALSVTLAEAEDSFVHEYCFEFIPTEDFSGLTISPEVRWASEPQYPMGKTCQVSILRGVAVMACA